MMGEGDQPSVTPEDRVRQLEQQAKTDEEALQKMLLAYKGAEADLEKMKTEIEVLNQDIVDKQRLQVTSQDFVICRKWYGIGTWNLATFNQNDIAGMLCPPGATDDCPGATSAASIDAESRDLCDADANGQIDVLA